MRKLLIVGAGQAGLQLGLGLLAHGYDVTVMSARTPDEIRAGRVMSTQCMFHTALQNERDQGLHLWEEHAPNIWALRLGVAGEGARALDFVGRLDDPAQSVDQRVKMASWLELFEQRGGKAIYHGVTTSDLNSLSRLYDLTLVAAGKGELVQLFDRDPDNSPFSTPQRALSVAYVHGARQSPDDPELTLLRFNVIPGVGELFVIPGYTFSGPCEIPFFEGIPGGPLDCWSDRPEPREHWRRMLDLMRQYLPWEYERFKGAELTDSQATLSGGYPPIVRQPVGDLPSGNPVLGLADVVVANDPITGQGSNNASKAAALYLHKILERGDQPFDRTWMQETFGRVWSDLKHVVRWTNMMLMPPPEHVMNIFSAATQHQEVADRFINAFNNPVDFNEWFMEAELAEQYLKRVISGHGG